VITLNGIDEYIDVSTPTGTPYSVGTSLPLIGGTPTERLGFVSGMSFELLFKTPDQQVAATVIDFGNGLF